MKRAESWNGGGRGSRTRCRPASASTATQCSSSRHVKTGIESLHGSGSSRERGGLARKPRDRVSQFEIHGNVVQGSLSPIQSKCFHDTYQTTGDSTMQIKKIPWATWSSTSATPTTGALTRTSQPTWRSLWSRRACFTSGS